MLLQAQSNAPGSSVVTLVDPSGADTGYRVLDGLNWGDAIWDVVYSGPRGTQGAVAAGATPQNRVVNVPLRVTGSSKDDLFAKISVVSQLVEELRRFGGVLTWRSKNGSFKVYFDVLAGAVAVSDWKPRGEHSNIAEVVLASICAPYARGDSMDILDDFSSNTLGNYTFDAGSAGNLAVTGGQLTVTANPATEERLIHTSVGYQYIDAQATLKAIPGSTITSFLAGVILNRIDASNYLRVYVDDNGTNSRLRIDKVVAGVTTNLATTNLAARVANGTAFWVRGRQEGVNVLVEYFLAAPSPMASATSSLNYTLSTAEQVTFGETVLGRVGIVWIPQQSAAVIDDFDADPYTYANRTLPEETIRLNGAIPGDAPALVEAYITPSGGAAAPIWAALGWWPKVGVWNRCWNGDFENALLGTNGWSVAGVANITNAATSITRITTAAKYGTCSGQIVCPATNSSGAAFRIFRRFRKGVTYTAECWVHSAAGTTNTIVRVGNSAGADTGQSANTPLSTTWQRVFATWTPTADRDDAYVALLITAATATTFEIDGVMVYEGTVAPTSANQSEGRGGFPPLGLLEAENSLSGPTSNANLRSGFGASSALIVIDPTLCVPDDYASNTIALEVWMRIEFSLAITATLSATPLTGSGGLPPIYTEEFGSVGKSVVPPSSGTVRRFTRLGTLRLPTNAGRFQLSAISLQTGTSTPHGTLDYLLLLPSTARALSPSGRANDASFPAFAPITSELTRRIRCDLSGTLKEPATGAPESPAPSLGGALLEMPPGQIEYVLKLSNLVPDDPTSNTSTEQLSHSATVHVAVMPRARLGRSS